MGKRAPHGGRGAVRKPARRPPSPHSCPLRPRPFLCRTNVAAGRAVLTGSSSSGGLKPLDGSKRIFLRQMLYHLTTWEMASGRLRALTSHHARGMVAAEIGKRLSRASFQNLDSMETT